MTGAVPDWPGADPGLARLLAAARRSLERTGGDLGARVGLAGPSEGERRAVSGLLGRHIAAGTRRVEIRLADLDARLRALHGVGLADALRDGGPLRDRPAEAARDLAAREALLSAAQASPLCGQGWFTGWIEQIRGNGTFTRLVQAPSRFRHALAVLEGIEALDGSTITLPGLAARATGDSHALDRRTPLSSLVLDALAARAATPRPATTEQRRELWDTFNVIVDDLASTVLVLNVPAAGRGLGDWLTGAATTATPFHITLHQLLTHPLDVAAATVYVCENPAVLREAADVLHAACPPLICTQGRPSTAFHRLTAKITDAGGGLRYHGDFDWPGIAMTAAVIDRHRARPWRMAAADYLHALGRSGAGAAGGDPVRLGGDRHATPWDPALGEAMACHGIAVYEEAVSDLPIADLGARSGA